MKMLPLNIFIVQIPNFMKSEILGLQKKLSEDFPRLYFKCLMNLKICLFPFDLFSMLIIFLFLD